MPIKTFTAGVLTSSDVNTFLMQQAVITCTSSTRPSSPVEGMTIYETDTDSAAMYMGTAFRQIAPVGTSAWTSYTPVVSGTGWAIGNGSTIGSFAQVGTLIFYRGSVTFGSTSTFGGSGLRVSMPSVLSAPNHFYSTTWTAVDVSANLSFVIIQNLVNNTTFAPYAVQSAAGLIEEIISTKPFTWASTDFIRFHGVMDTTL